LYPQVLHHDGTVRIHALEILGRLDGDDLAVAGGGRRYSPNAVQAMVRRK